MDKASLGPQLSPQHTRIYTQKRVIIFKLIRNGSFSFVYIISDLKCTIILHKLIITVIKGNN